MGQSLYVRSGIFVGQDCLIDARDHDFVWPTGALEYLGATRAARSEYEFFT